MSQRTCATKPKIVIYDCPPIVGNTLSSKLRSSGYDVIYHEKLTNSTADSSADIWVAKWTYRLDGEFLRCSHPKRGIVSLTSGVDHIDQNAIREFDLSVVNCPTFSSNSVAEHAMALALRTLYPKACLPPSRSGRVIFRNFSDDFAESAVAQMLMRSRQMEESIIRAKNYDYSRKDFPWSNTELAKMKVLIAGNDRPSATLAQILKLGFDCDVYGFHADQELETYNVQSVGVNDFHDLAFEADYIFLCTDKLGRLDESKAYESTELPRTEIHFVDSKVAVLGTGGIGSVIARIARLGFNCDVTAFNTSEKENLRRIAVRYIDAKKEPVERAIADADFIFVALPLNPNTQSMIAGEMLSKLPSRDRPRILINVTRDKIVESESVYRLLCNGMLMGYATDVVPNDYILWKSAQSDRTAIPDEVTQKFLDHTSVVATPHEGECSKQSLMRLGNELVERLSSILT